MGQQEVIKYLEKRTKRKSGEWFRTEEISSATGINFQTVSRILRTMRRYGEIEFLEITPFTKKKVQKFLNFSIKDIKIRRGMFLYRAKENERKKG